MKLTSSYSDSSSLISFYRILTLLMLTVMYITIDKTSIYRPTSQRIPFMFFTTTKPTMLFRETVGFYFKNHVKDKRHRLCEIEKFLTLQ
jgi:hypothetical protein